MRSGAQDLEASDDPAVRTGRARAAPRSRILATLPPEAATESRARRKAVDAGMDFARIDCAHDDAEAWAAMIDNIRAAESQARRRVPRDDGYRRAEMPPGRGGGPTEVAGHLGDRRSDTQADPGSHGETPASRFRSRRLSTSSKSAPRFSSTTARRPREWSKSRRTSRNRGLCGARKRRSAEGGQGHELPDHRTRFAAVDAARIFADLDFVAAHADLVGSSSFSASRTSNFCRTISPRAGALAAAAYSAQDRDAARGTQLAETILSCSPIIRPR